MQAGEVAGAHTSETRLAAKFLVRGIVRDPSGRPVAGAAVLVGKEMAFTDLDGTFFVRFRKAKTVPIKVVPRDFRAPGNWRVISAPDLVTPQPKDNTKAVNIEVSQRA